MNKNSSFQFTILGVLINFRYRGDVLYLHFGRSAADRDILVTNVRRNTNRCLFMLYGIMRLRNEVRIVVPRELQDCACTDPVMRDITCLPIEVLRSFRVEIVCWEIVLVALLQYA